MQRRAFRRLLSYLALTACAMQAIAQDQRTCAQEDCVRTPYGLVEVKPSAQDARASDLLLGGEAIKTFERSLHLRAAHPDREQASLILLESTDEKSCVMYRVLEVKSKDDVRLSGEFGACGALVADADKARLGVTESIAFENGEWRFALAPANGESARAERYAYQDGKVYQHRIVAGKSEDPEAAAAQKLALEVPDAQEREALIRKHGSAYHAYRWLLLQKGLEMDPRKNRRK